MEDLNLVGVCLRDVLELMEGQQKTKTNEFVKVFETRSLSRCNQLFFLASREALSS